MKFSFSENALAKLKKLQKQGSVSLRIRVDSGGCAGFQYIFLMNEDSSEDDLIFEKEGMRVLIDSLSFSFLEGSVLDYTEEMIGASFVIQNPNAGRSCGCKSSFSLSDVKKA